METNPFDTFTLSVLLILLVVAPLMGLWDYRRLMRWHREGRGNARLKMYHETVAIQWGLTIGLLAWWFLSGRAWETLGMIGTYSGWGWLALGLGLAAAGYMIWQMNTVMKSPQELHKLRDQMGDLGALAPITRREGRSFALVSITAGVCEEILYRGILMTVLIPAVGLWPAVGLSSVVFGMGHAYQGFGGIVKTTLVGLVLALLTVFSGSVLVAMVLHTVIDLTSGRMMGAALREKMGGRNLEGGSPGMFQPEAP